MPRDAPSSDHDDEPAGPPPAETPEPNEPTHVDENGTDESAQAEGNGTDESAQPNADEANEPTRATDPAGPARTDADRESVRDAAVTYDAGGRREVELPLRLYKTVTVFSTLIAVVCVVVGFLMLDAATLGGSLLRRGVAAGLSSAGLDVADGTLSALFAAAGLLTIGLGAGVYVLGTRFRAPGMTGSRDDEE